MKTTHQDTSFFILNEDVIAYNPKTDKKNQKKLPLKPKEESGKHRTQ
jgi:hypothetical protein